MQIKQHNRESADPSPRKPAFRPRRGGSLVELALTLGILLNLTFGMVEFGYYFYVKHSLEGAGREGCRAFICAGATLTDVTNAVNTSMTAANLASSGYTVVVKDGETTTYNMLITPEAPPGEKLKAARKLVGALSKTPSDRTAQILLEFRKLNHTIDETGVSVPEGFGDEDEAPKKK